MMNRPENALIIELVETVLGTVNRETLGAALGVEANANTQHAHVHHEEEGRHNIIVRIAHAFRRYERTIKERCKSLGFDVFGAHGPETATGREHTKIENAVKEWATKVLQTLFSIEFEIIANTVALLNVQSTLNDSLDRVEPIFLLASDPIDGTSISSLVCDLSKSTISKLGMFGAIFSQEFLVQVNTLGIRYDGREIKRQTLRMYHGFMHIAGCSGLVLLGQFHEHLLPVGAIFAFQCIDNVLVFERW